MAQEPSTQTAFRIPDRILVCVDEYTEELGRRVPGAKFKRSDAFRALIVRGLEAEGLPVPETGPEE